MARQPHPLTVRIDRTKVDRIDRLAAQLGITRNRFIVENLDLAIARLEEGDRVA